jgi:hypothetical protein
MSRLVLRVLSIVAVAGLLAACSSMPEWTKPSSWYDGVTEKKAPVEQKAEAKPTETQEVTQTAAPGEGGLVPVVDPLDPESDKKKSVALKAPTTPTEFPNLSTQPAPRQAGTTDAQQREIRDSLVADRDNAQHSADELRGGTTPAAAPPTPAAATPAADKVATDQPKDE